MGSKRKVFLYELATGKSIEFGSQTSAGEFIGEENIVTGKQIGRAHV